DVDLRWVFALALLGTGLAAARRLRVGIFLALATLGAGVAFVVLPEGRLWNGRLLPFYYLTTMLLAGLAVSELVRTVSDIVRGPRRAPVTAGVPVALGALAVILVVVGVPLGQLPYTRAIEGGYQWPRFSPWRVTATPASFVPSWARWNFSGYELQETYREYRDVVTTMAELGEQRGCGRAFWEYDKELLDSYGRPMSLMLLPHGTDGCIRSMEGLYFEASATTPFHCLVQVELSTNPSAAQRDLPYGHFDIAKGVDHLQMMGVRYYMATSDNAVAQARSHPDLTEVAASGPWVIFEVADSPLVEPLARARRGRGPRRQPRRLGRAAARRGRPVRRAGDPLVQRARALGRPDRRVGAGGLAARRPRRGARGPAAGGGRGARRRLRGRAHPLRGRPGRRAGAGEGLVLPQLAGDGRRGPVAGGAQLHGGRPHRHRGRADLRPHARRV